MAILSARSLGVTFIERNLFSDVSFDVEKRDKVGFIGRNGTGKTTLFKVITGELSPTTGSVVISKDTRVGYMKQHACEDFARTVYDELLSVFEPLMKQEREIEALSREIDRGEGDINALVEKQTRLIDDFNGNGGLTFRSRVRATLLGLGFSEEDISRQVGTLSGGQASKLSLAKLLLSGADLLLLDEPTNHLDINSVRWLEGFLKDFQGAAIIISHDRYFLDAVTNKTIELEHKRIMTYEGNYSLFMKKKAHELEAQRRLYEKDMKEIRRIEGIVEQQKRWGREHNFITAASKQKEADRIKERLQKPESEESSIKLSFEPDRESGNDVLIAKNMSKSFDNTTLFSGVDIHIRKGERVFILGDNGTGKTTLFKILAGKCEGEYDELTLGARVDMGYFDQMQSDLNLENDAVSEISDAYPRMNNTEIRSALGAFLIKGDEVFKPLKRLSGGERARISLLKLVLSGANFFLLDEPTNHLDAPSREALEDTLRDYEGTMLIISHDRYFVNKLATRILYLTENGVREYLGNYDYFAEKTAQDSSEVKDIFSNNQQSAEEKPRQNDYKLRKEAQAKERKRQNDLKKCEAQIEKLDAEIARVEELISSPEAAGDYEKLLSLTAELETLQEKQAEAFTLWEELMEE